MFAVFSPFRVTLFFAVLAVAALLIIPRLHTSLAPEEKSTTFTINFGLANSSPDVVEQQVTAVLENALSQVAGIKSIRSRSGYNSGQIWLEFDAHADFAMKQFEITSLIRQVYPRLPQQASFPTVIPAVRETQESKKPLLIYTVHAPQQPFQIRQAVEERIIKNLAGIPALQSARASGVAPLQVVIKYDINKCRAYQVSPAAISTALQQQYTDSYTGAVNTSNGTQYFLRVHASATTVKSIANTVMPVLTGYIRIGDIATVFLEEQEQQQYFRINGKNAITLNLYARKGSNMIVLAAALKAAVKRLTPHLPAGYKIQLSHDDSAYLQREITKNYQRELLSITILTLFILLSYRRWRYLLVLIGTMAVNVCLMLLLAWIFGVDIHLYTLAGIAIAFSVMVDNAIIMLDYYRQFRHRKVLPALMAATLTTIGALSLVLLLPEEQRKDLYDFSLIIILALAAAIAVVYWFTPAVYVLLFPAADQKQVHRNYVQRKRNFHWRRRYFRLVQFISRHRIAYCILLVLLFGLPVFMMPDKWSGDAWYHRLYNEYFGSDYYRYELRPHVDKWLGGSMGYFINTVGDRSGYRKPEETMLYVTAYLPQGNTAAQLNHILSGFERLLAKIDGVEKFVTEISSAQEGSIRIYFTEAVVNTALPYRLKSKLIAKSVAWGGVKWQISGLGQAFTNNVTEEVPNFEIIMKGYNYDELDRLAELLARKLVRHKRVRKVESNARQDLSEEQGNEYLLNLDREQLALQHTNDYEVINALRERSLPAGPAFNITLHNNYYPVLIKEAASEDYSRHDVLHTPLQVNGQTAVRVKDIGSFVFRETAAAINKENRQYIRTVSCEYVGGRDYGEEYMEQTLKELRPQMPVGYTARVNGMFAWDVYGKQYRNLVFLLLLVVFFICSVLFGNLRQPFFIIIMIPLSFIGLFLVFAIGGFYFDQGGYAAFLMLGGMVANASIYIVNDLNNLKRQSHQHYNRLLIKATYNRSRTILLTTLSTCCGLLPFILEGQQEVFWFSFAAGAMGGLIFSLITVCFVLPVFLYRR